MVLRETLELTIDTGQLQRELRRLSQQLRELSGGNIDLGLDRASLEMRTFEQETARTARALQSISSTTVSVDVDSADAVAAIDRVQTELGAIQSETVEIDGDASDAVAAADRAQTELDAIPDNITVNIDGDVSDLTRSAQELNDLGIAPLVEGTGALTGLLGGIAVPAGAAAGALAGIGAGAAAALSTFADFQDQVSEVLTLLPGTGIGFDEVSEKVRQFSLDTGVATEDVLPALYSALSTGVSFEDSFEFLGTAFEASVAGVTELEAATSLLSGTQNAFSSQALTTADAADTLFTTVRLGATTFGELANELPQVTPLAASLNLSFADLSNTIATATAATGLRTNIFVTQLRALLTELGDFSKGVGEDFERNTGQSLADFLAAGNDVTDVVRVLSEISEETGESFTQLFGSSEAALAAQILADNIDGLSDNLGEFETRAGAASVAFEESAGNISLQFDRLRAAFNEILLSVGEEIADALADVDLEQFTNDVIEASETVIGAIQNLSAALEFLNENGFISFGGISDLLEILSGDWLEFGDLAIGVLDQLLGPLNELIGLIPGVGDPIDGVREDWERFKASVEGTDPGILARVSERNQEALRGSQAAAREAGDELSRVAAETAAAFAAAEFGVGGVSNSFRDAEERAGALARRLADIEFGQVDFGRVLDDTFAADYLAQIEELAPRVAALFGNPFTPALTDEDINAYIDRVIELQAAAAQYQFNLLRLEEELDEEEFSTLLDLFDAAGEEAGALFAAQLVDQVGTAEFDVLREQLEQIATATELGPILARKIAEAQLTPVPVQLDVNTEQLRLLGEQLLGVDVVANLDDAEIAALVEDEYNITVVPDVEPIPPFPDQTVAVNLSQGNFDAFFDNLQAFFDNNPVTLNNVIIGGVSAEAGGFWNRAGVRMFERGGQVAWNPGRGVPFVLPDGGLGVYGESFRGPETLEVGPNGMAIVGGYHEDDLSDRRLMAAGINAAEFPRIQRLMAATASSARVTVDSGPLAAENAQLRGDLQRVTKTLERMERGVLAGVEFNTGRQPRERRSAKDRGWW